MTIRKTIFDPHIQPYHWGNFGGRSDRDWIADWEGGQDLSFIKMVTVDEQVPYLNELPAHSNIIVRNHPLSELHGDRGFPALTANVSANLVLPEHDKVSYIGGQGSGRDLLRSKTVAVDRAFSSFLNIRGITRTPEAVGIEHAEICNRIAANCEAKGVARTRLLFEGLNEPMLWSTEPPALVARYYRSFALGLRKNKLRGVLGNFGVGWPGNGGAKDAPVQWDFWKPVIDIWDVDMYLGLHEYWDLNGPEENWGWWAGRYEQCPFQIPMIMTEIGIDTGVSGRWYGGWLDLPGTTEDKVRRYIAEKARYQVRAIKDGRIVAATPFTWDGVRESWGKFDYRIEQYAKAYNQWAASKPAEALGYKVFKWTGVSLPPVTPPPPATVDAFTKDMKAVFGDANFVDLRATLPVHATNKYVTRPQTAIKRIIVHHAGPPTTEATTWKSVATYHVSAHGWPGIGYHIGVDMNGKINYVGDLLTIRNHSGSAGNPDSIAICAMGNYEAVQPAKIVVDRINQLCDAIQRFFGREMVVMGHKDVYGTTQCPGQYLYKTLFAIPVSTDPVGDASLNEIDVHQLIRLNATAAIQKRIIDDGFQIITNEFDLVMPPKAYIVQGAQHPVTGKKRAYRVEKRGDGTFGPIEMREK